MKDIVVAGTCCVVPWELMWRWADHMEAGETLSWQVSPETVKGNSTCKGLQFDRGSGSAIAPGAVTSGSNTGFLFCW